MGFGGIDRILSNKFFSPRAAFQVSWLVPHTRKPANWAIRVLSRGIGEAEAGKAKRDNWSAENAATPGNYQLEYGWSS